VKPVGRSKTYKHHAVNSIGHSVGGTKRVGVLSPILDLKCGTHYWCLGTWVPVRFKPGTLVSMQDVKR